MSRVAIVLSFERVTDEGFGADVKCDPGGNALVTAPHYADPGDDSAPLPGDFVALDESSGMGAEHATGYADVKNPGKSVPGEKRIYARDATGAVVADMHLRRDGSIVIHGASITIHGNVTIEGALATTGDVTARAGTPAAVKLSTHVHPTAVGPTSPPTPGT